MRRDLPRQSYVGAIFTDRELADDHNRVGGVDGRYKFDDNWDARFQAVSSSTRTTDGERLDGPAYDLAFNRGGRHFTTHAHYQDYARDFVTETGFVPRVDIRTVHQSSGYTFRPEGPRLISWEPRLFVEYLEDQSGLRLDERIAPEISWSFRRQTNVGLFLSLGRERLRPEDFAELSEPLDFEVRRYAAWFETRFLASLSANGRLELREAINFAPPPGEPPVEDDELRASVGLTGRPGRRHVIDVTYFRTELEDPQDDATFLVNDIARTRWNWQVLPQLSLRTILQYDRTRVDAQYTVRENEESFNADFLLIYLVNPWTALYAGYNASYADFDAEQLFVKLSYLHRF